MNTFHARSRSKTGGALLAAAGWSVLLTLAWVGSVRAQGLPFLELEPGEQKDFLFHCQVNGQMLANCCTTWSHWYHDNSGGHKHNQNRPLSDAWVSSYCYSGYDGIILTVDANHDIGHKEYLYVCMQQCPTCTVYCDFTDIVIRYWPMFDLYGDGVPPYNRPIGATSTHPDNHWGSPTLVSAVDQVTQQY